MNTTTADLSVISYPVAEAEIARKREEYSSLKIGGVNDKDGYRMVKAARIDMKNDRVAVENRRKELKSGALEFGRKVDESANHLKGMISEVENKLKKEEQTYLDEVERIKQAEEAKKREKLNQRLEKLQAVDCVLHPMVLEELTDNEFNEKLKEATEEKRIAEEETERLRKEEEDRIRKEEEARKAEQLRLEEERKQIEEQRRIQAEEQRKLDEQKQAIEDEKNRIARDEELRVQREQAAEKARIETERNLKAQEEAKAARLKAEGDEVARLEAMKPDVTKLLELANRVEALAYSVDVSEKSTELKTAVDKRIVGCAAMIRNIVQTAMNAE